MTTTTIHTSKDYDKFETDLINEHGGYVTIDLGDDTLEFDGWDNVYTAIVTVFTDNGECYKYNVKISHLAYLRAAYGDNDCNYA